MAFEQPCNVTFLQGTHLEKSKEQIIRRDCKECSYYASLSSGKGNGLLFLATRKYPSSEPNPNKTGIVCWAHLLIPPPLFSGALIIPKVLLLISSENYLRCKQLRKYTNAHGRRYRNIVMDPLRNSSWILKSNSHRQ